MKKFIAILLVVGCLFCAFACKKTTINSQNTSQLNTSSSSLNSSTLSINSYSSTTQQSSSFTIISSVSDIVSSSSSISQENTTSSAISSFTSDSQSIISSSLDSSSIISSTISSEDSSESSSIIISGSTEQSSSISIEVSSSSSLISSSSQIPLYAYTLTVEPISESHYVTVKLYQNGVEVSGVPVGEVVEVEITTSDALHRAIGSVIINGTTVFNKNEYTQRVTASGKMSENGLQITVKLLIQFSNT